jgi:hypothetical protein
MGDNVQGVEETDEEYEDRREKSMPEFDCQFLKGG